MRVLIALSGTFTPLGHAIARKLKEDYGVTHFSAFVVTKRALDFVRSQRDIVYEPLVYDDDIRQDAESLRVDKVALERLEEEYGTPNLWSFVLMDRNLVYPFEGHPFHRYGTRMDLQQTQRLVQAYFQAAVELLDQAKPDYIICRGGVMGLLVLGHVARKRGIHTLYINATPVLNRVTIASDPYQTHDRVYHIYKKVACGMHHSTFQADAEAFIRAFRKERMSYTWFKPSILASHRWRLSLGRSLTWPLRQLRQWLRYASARHFPAQSRLHLTLSTWRVLWGSVLMSYRRFKLLNWPGYSEFDGQSTYAFFPLQYEPELTIMEMASMYTDQAQVVRGIARSLPMAMKLYVKEHPSMFGFRSEGFYKRLLGMPNVYLLRPNLDSHEIIRNARVVITINGTAGFEAALLGKPAITLGEVFYNRLELVQRATSLNDLPKVVDHVLAHYQHDDKRLTDFVTAIFEGSVEADFVHLMALSKEPGGFPEIWNHPHLNNLARLVAAEMGLPGAEPLHPLPRALADRVTTQGVG